MLYNKCDNIYQGKSMESNKTKHVYTLCLLSIIFILISVLLTGCQSTDKSESYIAQICNIHSLPMTQIKIKQKLFGQRL